MGMSQKEKLRRVSSILDALSTNAGYMSVFTTDEGIQITLNPNINCNYMLEGEEHQSSIEFIEFVMTEKSTHIKVKMGDQGITIPISCIKTLHTPI